MRAHRALCWDSGGRRRGVRDRADGEGMEERAAREGREVRMGAGLPAGGARAADRGLSVRMSVFVEQRGRERKRSKHVFGWR